jgi:hypothetical protein
MTLVPYEVVGENANNRHLMRLDRLRYSPTFPIEQFWRFSMEYVQRCVRISGQDGAGTLRTCIFTTDLRQ